MSDNHDAPHDDHDSLGDSVSDAGSSGAAGSSRMTWLGPIIALLFCAGILAGIGVANAASYDGELPHKDDHHGDDHDDEHGDEDDHSDDDDHE